MFEYLTPEKKDRPKTITRKKEPATQRRVVLPGDVEQRPAEKQIRPTYGGQPIIQSKEICANCFKTLNQCNCGNFDPIDSETEDPTYAERSHEQYLDPVRLRTNLNAKNKSGEAHHIFPGNVVKEKNLDNNGANKNAFNEAWNGIMLNGTTKSGQPDIIHEYLDLAPTVLHRKNGRLCHTNYDKNIKKYIKRREIDSVEKCKDYVPDLRLQIFGSTAESLDDLPDF